MAQYGASHLATHTHIYILRMYKSEVWEMSCGLRRISGHAISIAGMNVDEVVRTDAIFLSFSSYFLQDTSRNYYEWAKIKNIVYFPSWPKEKKNVHFLAKFHPEVSPSKRIVHALVLLPTVVEST